MGKKMTERDETDGAITWAMMIARILLFVCILALISLDITLYLVYEYLITGTSWTWDAILSFMQIVYPGMLLLAVITKTTNSNFLSLAITLSFITVIFEGVSFFFTSWLTWVWGVAGYPTVFWIKVGVLGVTVVSAIILWIYMFLSMIDAFKYMDLVQSTLPAFRDIAKKYKQMILMSWTGALVLSAFLTIMHFLNYVWPLTSTEYALHVHWFFAFVIFPVIEYNYHPLTDGRHYAIIVIVILTVVMGLILLDVGVGVANLSYLFYLVVTGSFSYSLANLIVTIVQMASLSLIVVLEITCFVILVAYGKVIRGFALNTLSASEST
jgi:hypothetical protein